MPRNYLERPAEMERAEATSSVPAVLKTYPVTGPPSGPAADSMGLNEIAAMLWRGKWIIVPVALAGLAAGLIITTQMPPVYRARTSVEIEAYNDQVLPDLGPMSSSIPNATPDNYLQNELKLLESDSLARVADVIQPKPQPQGWLDIAVAEVESGFGLFPQRPESPQEWRVHAIQAALNVRTSVQSQVIDLFFDAGDPQRAALGANAAVDTFIAMNNEARSQLIQDTTQWLNQQAGEMRAKIDGANQQLEGFARSSGLVFAENQNTLAEDQMKEIEDELAKATADRVEKQAQYEAARDNPARLIMDSTQNSPLRQYEINLEALKAQLAQLKTQFTGDYYKVRQVESQIAATEAEMDGERTELLGRMRVDFIAAASQERMLQQKHTEQLKTVQQQMENQRRYETEKSQVDAMEKLYETMLQKAKEAGAASAMRATNVRVIDPATPPSSTYSPRPALNAAIGLALGLIVGMAFVFVRGESDRVKRPGESPLPEVPELGVIPSSSSGWVPNGNGHRGRIPFGRRGEPGLVKWDEDASMLTESFRAALTSILFGPSAKRDGGGQVLVVTSANMTEGKTTVIANLGIASAERRRRVLLIDADLRRPMLHAAFKLENDRGLATVLQESSRAEDFPIDSCIQRGSVPGLYVMTAGPAGSANLLYSCDMSALLERLRREFDLVFIDTPPMLLYSDSRVLGRISDGVVMVVRADSTRAEELRTVYSRLMQDQIPVIGTILNKWKMDAGQHRAYGRYYANYGAGRGA